MLSRIFLIILWCCVACPAVAGAAGLTFGAAPGATRSLETEDQARALAEDLADALDDALTVRLFDNQQQIGQWLNQFAMLDLAVMDEAFLGSHPGEFLVLGPVEQGSSLFVVARQGTTGNLPQRVARILRREGGMRITPSAEPPPVAATAAPPKQVAAPSAQPLLLGFVAGRAAVFASGDEAELFAARLGERLGTPVRVRPFDSEQGLADWFLRFRMIDLAVIAEPGRRDPLVGDYRQLERLPAVAGRAGLLVARRDLPAGSLDQMVQALAGSGRAVSRADAPPPPPSESPAAEAPRVPSPPVLPPLPAASPEEPPVAAVVPAPVAPVPPELPAWPEVPPVTPPPAPPVDRPPVPALPLLPPMPVAEEPVPSGVVEPVDALPTEPVSPAVVTFEMPASIGPLGDAGESAGPAALPPSEALPQVAAPVASPPVAVPPPPSATVAEAVAAPEPEEVPAAPVAAMVPDLPFIPEPPKIVEETAKPDAVTEPPAPAVAAVAVPAAPVPAPPEAAAAIPDPEPSPELPFIPVPPRVIEAPALSETAVIGSKAAEAAVPAPPPAPVVETAVVAPLEAASVPVVTVTAADPAAVPAGEPETQALPEELAGLPFIPVPPRVVQEHSAAEPASVTEEPLLALAGADQVPDIIAQPDLPQELRPPGVPLPRPGRVPKETPPAVEPLLLAKLDKPLGTTPKPPPLLPQPDAEPGVVYVAPFITLMVPNEVRERIFDLFVDTLNQRGGAQKLKFVILKQGLDKIDRNWLAARKYVLGEIYGYVEDSGCCSTDLRTRARLTFYRAHRPEPALKFEYPVRTFFDHDRSNLTAERQKLADQIAAVLVDEMLKALQP